MTRANDRTAHRAWALGATATLVVSLAVAFQLLGSGSAEAATVTGVHGPYTTIADECATCHRVHTGKNTSLLTSPAPESNLCLTCHNGTGAQSNVKAQYDSAPANNAAAREYYSHEARVATSHTAASDATEFVGVLNRHSECGDCHNPHKVNATNSTETTSGWTASGRLAGISGVSVSNTPTVITPTFLDGKTNPITREYQLCFKCHSGFTALPSNTGFTPSKYLLDKAVEFYPNNLSFHPVEAPGTNRTVKMAASLAGPSPYKLSQSFTVDSTIRCSNCHASSTKFTPATPPSPGADLPPHASANRGILLQNYRDRVLKSSTEAYSNADFALCFLCHTNTPFATETATATNFDLHGLHLTGLAGKGTGGTDIDTPGAGQGNAICAECHFRLHSTTYKTGSQTIEGSRLVNFAPNVQANSGRLQWTPGSCNLTCHGKQHSYGY